MENFCMCCKNAWWKAVCLLAILTTVPFFVRAQVAINADGAQPHPSAMLEVKSTNKGLLIPRMTALQRLAIPSPADGLMVYDTDSSLVMLYRTVSGWTSPWHPGAEPHRIIDNDKDTWADAYTNDSGTAHQDGDIIVFNLGDAGVGGTGTVEMILRKNANGQARLEFPDAQKNTLIGDNAGENTMTGLHNVALGYDALHNNTFGNFNTAIGFEALYSAKGQPTSNTALGYQALRENIDGLGNTALGFQTMYSNKGYLNTAAGYEAMKSNFGGWGNTAFGKNALYSNISGAQNTALGFDALRSNTSGRGNVAVGMGAAYTNSISHGLVAVGDSALYFNHQGQFNTAIGRFSLLLNTSGSFNTALGATALQQNTTGASNTALGYQALYNNETGGQNVAVGQQALRNNSNGAGNVGVGNNALAGNTTGQWNTAVGQSAGEGGGINLSCEGCTFLGAQTGLSGLGFDAKNVTAIGFHAEVGCDNCIVLGGSGAYAANVGIGRSPSTNKLEVEGQASKSTAGPFIANSDARLKKNIQALQPDEMLNKLLELRGITFEWDDHKTGTARPAGIQYGFTAQNIRQVFPSLVEEDARGYLQTAYSTYDAMMIEAMRALHQKITVLEAENSRLQGELDRVQSTNIRLQEQLNALQTLEARIQALETKQ